MARVQSTELGAAQGATQSLVGSLVNAIITSPDETFSIDPETIKAFGVQAALATDPNQYFCGELEFIGTPNALASFELEKWESTPDPVRTLSTPHDLSSGPLHISLGASVATPKGWLFSLRSKFTDSAEYELTINLKDVGGIVIDTIIWNVTVPNPFIAEAESQASLLGVWSPSPLANGVIANLANAMVDISSKNAAALVHHNDGTGVGTWSVIDTDGPGGLSGLEKCVESTRRERDSTANSAYAITAALVSASKSGVAFFKMPGGLWTETDVTEIVGLGDDVNGDNHGFTGVNPNRIVHFYALASADSDFTHLSAVGSKWVALSWRKDVAGSPAKATLALTDMSVSPELRSLGDLGVEQDATSNAWTDGLNDKLRIGTVDNGGGFSLATARHGAIVAYSTDVGDTALLDLLKTASL